MASKPTTIADIADERDRTEAARMKAAREQNQRTIERLRFALAKLRAKHGIPDSRREKEARRVDLRT